MQFLEVAGQYAARGTLALHRRCGDPPIVDDGERAARGILTGHFEELHALAKGLLEFETLSADEIRRLIKGERIVRETSTGPATEEPRPIPAAQLGAAVGPADRPRTRPQPGG